MKFTELLSQLNIEFRTEGKHCRPGWINIDCPWCEKNSRKFHLGYSLQDHYLNCWKCGYKRPIEVLMEITGKPFYECKKLLGDIRPVTIHKKKTDGRLLLPRGRGPLKRPHQLYLRDRGFDPLELEKLWRIQGIGIAGKLPWRIFIPIIYHGKVVSWTTRSIASNKAIPRYVSASLKQESMPHKSLLYGEDYANQTIIITEGPFDVWRIGPGAVATLGVGYSNDQVIKMTKYQKRVICFDSDDNAQRRAKILCDGLSVFPGETYNVCLDSKDAADASRGEIEMLRTSFLKK